MNLNWDLEKNIIEIDPTLLTIPNQHLSITTHSSDILTPFTKYAGNIQPYLSNIHAKTESNILNSTLTLLILQSQVADHQHWTYTKYCVSSSTKNSHIINTLVTPIISYYMTTSFFVLMRSKINVDSHLAKCYILH